MYDKSSYSLVSAPQNEHLNGLDVQQYLRKYARQSRAADIQRRLPRACAEPDGTFALQLDGTGSKSLIVLAPVLLHGKSYFPIVVPAGSRLIGETEFRALQDGPLAHYDAYVVEKSPLLTTRVGKSLVTIDSPWKSVYCRRPLEISNPALFVVTNQGESSVYLDPPVLHCSCAMAKAWDSQIVLPPGESVSLEVSIRSNGAATDQKELLIALRDSPQGREIGIPLRIYRWEAASMRVAPAMLNLGFIGDSKDIVREICLEEVATDRFSITDIASSSCPVEWNIQTSTNADGLLKYIAAVTFPRRNLDSAIDTAKDFKGTLKISTTSALRPTVEIPFTVLPLN